MVRVKNEERFLSASIESILDSVDEIVLIDNLSDDATPDIIADLVRAHPKQIRSVVYPHRIALAGAQNRELASSPGGLKSPRLLANYYTWCITQCSNNWVLKWDADMVATPEFGRAMRAFRSSSKQVLNISGANVHPDLSHFLKDEWFYTAIEFYEPRVFCRRLSRYGDYGGPHEALYTPYKSRPWFLRHEELTYVHLKYCKDDPQVNNSDEDRPPFAPGAELPADLAAIAAAAVLGDPLV